jgi:hypothetical protein
MDDLSGFQEVKRKKPAPRCTNKTVTATAAKDWKLPFSGFYLAHIGLYSIALQFTKWDSFIGDWDPPHLVRELYYPLHIDFQHVVKLLPLRTSANTTDQRKNLQHRQTSKHLAPIHLF